MPAHLALDCEPPVGSGRLAHPRAVNLELKANRWWLEAAVSGMDPVESGQAMRFRFPGGERDRGCRPCALHHLSQLGTKFCETMWPWVKSPVIPQ
ncbi:unnamed protein product [Effrenium voratum]|nr:unnamed protein product [Effrenium voratum]